MPGAVTAAVVEDVLVAEEEDIAPVVLAMPEAKPEAASGIPDINLVWRRWQWWR